MATRRPRVLLGRASERQMLDRLLTNVRGGQSAVLVVRGEARDGLSNPEIGARLFLSPRTVEWHVHKVFSKLEIHSRHELSAAMLSSESELAPA